MKKFNFLFLLLLFTVFIYTPQIIILGYTLKTIFIFPLISLYYLISNNFTIRIPRYLILYYWIILIFSVFIFIRNGYVETFIIKQLVLFPFIYITCQFFLDYGFSYNFEKLVYFITYVLLINSAVILFFSIFSDLNPILHSFINITEKQYKYIYNSLVIRHSGISVSGFSYLGFYMSCLYIITFFYFIKKKFSIYFFIISIFVFTSSFFVARTSVIILFVFFLLYLVLTSFTNKKGIFGILLSVSLIFVFINQISNINIFAFQSIDRSLDFIFSSVETGEFDNKSLQDLSYERSSFQLDNYLLGDRNFGRDLGLISDIGYISFLKGSGVLGLIIFLFHFWYPLIRQFFTLNFISPVFFVLTTMILFNLKDLVFLEHGYIQAYCIAISLQYCKHENEN